MIVPRTRIAPDGPDTALFEDTQIAHSGQSDQLNPFAFDDLTNMPEGLLYLCTQPAEALYLVDGDGHEQPATGFRLPQYRLETAAYLWLNMDVFPVEIGIASAAAGEVS